jgi:hypothetical protein
MFQGVAVSTDEALGEGAPFSWLAAGIVVPGPLNNIVPEKL